VAKSFADTFLHGVTNPAIAEAAAAQNAAHANRVVSA